MNIIKWEHVLSYPKQTDRILAVFHMSQQSFSVDPKDPQKKMPSKLTESD